MAIWQVKLRLIPTNALRAKFGTMPITIPQNLADDSWSSDVQPRPGLEASIDTVLPRANSWSEDMLIWGDERGDAAIVCYDNDRKVEDIEFRVDVRRLSPALVGRICDLAKELECMLLLTRSGQLIAADDQALLAAIHHSTAKKYLNDPVSTLLDISSAKGEIVQLPEKTKKDEA